MKKKEEERTVEEKEIKNSKKHQDVSLKSASQDPSHQVFVTYSIGFKS